ncbi:YggS family pyridoxal phosphate-dependent enzyme [Bermanella marisrubri]|uniref:Pyridoxal phosphate homeostasis protein n=1 Tax=Bermanella marisrubri TaxID=207949 RepID=Q1N4D3_9GAMM|nr:YggS family pyridoxal phosphate-dependent enzyme [Bermanella marisrubri]EAT12932.1 Predicted enzyme with a TIM-barrel fold protein [Oceanobacter sp. RED65] [Bermanella marisrubri]QIZ82937.1 YggS family pyridoxal phosphate-dependent enzyme [Bermanella marisrubri]
MDLATSEALRSRFEQVQHQINDACAQYKQNTVQLLAVSKRHSIEAIRAIHALGQQSFGENYVQEGVDKINALSDLAIEWHFIGPLQSNKTKDVAEHFAWMHTLERDKIAKRLSQQRPSHLPPLNVLIQINISQQESKSGISLQDLPALAQQVNDYDNLCLRGLMCIPAPQDEASLTQDFCSMFQAFEKLKQQYSTVDTLSMGMSGDLELAIEQGSTMVRVGSAIFGPRDSIISNENNL